MIREKLELALDVLRDALEEVEAWDKQQGPLGLVLCAATGYVLRALQLLERERRIPIYVQKTEKRKSTNGAKEHIGE